jgi:ABC-type phosphate/phosphonate transport system substrate-binding protein
VLVAVIVPAAVVAVPGVPARAAEPAPLRMGMPESMFSGLPPAIVQVGAQPFKDMLEKQTGLKGEVTVTKDYADTTAQLRAGKLDVAVYHGFEYAWVREHPELIPLMVTVPGNKLQACLVVHTESKLKGPDELKGECVAVPVGTKAHCLLYLDRLKETLPPNCCGAAKLEGKTIEDALDAVASGKCESALIDVATLHGYQKLKPGVGTQLKILDQSVEFPSAVIVYRKDVFNAKTEKTVRDGLLKGMTTPQGQVLKSLWKLKGFAEVGPAYQTELDRCLKSYPAPKK